MCSLSSRLTTTDKRLNQSGPSAKFLRKGPASGKIDLSQRPKAMLGAHRMQFEGHALDQDRGCPRKLRMSDGKMLIEQGTLQ